MTDKEKTLIRLNSFVLPSPAMAHDSDNIQFFENNNLYGAWDGINSSYPCTVFGPGLMNL